MINPLVLYRGMPIILPGCWHPLPLGQKTYRFGRGTDTCQKSGH